MRETETPWYEQDEFWETFATSIFDEERHALAPTEVENILRLLAVKPGEHICDLCCGIGRHSLEFAVRGLHVTGVDRTHPYLQTAMGRARNRNLEIEFVEEDMRTFCRPETFDAVVNMFTSFGYFEAPGDNRRVLENIHRSLKPGGKLLIDVIGKEILARIFHSRDWRPAGDGLLLEERKVLDAWGRIEARWTLIKSGRQHEWMFSHRIYCATELRGLLEDCGFREPAVYGNLSGAPYDEKAERLVVVGRK